MEPAMKTASWMVDRTISIVFNLSILASSIIFTVTASTPQWIVASDGRLLKLRKTRLRCKKVLLIL